MTIVLIILGVIIGLVGLLLILALFTKKDFAVQRAIVIHRPTELVYDYLRHLKNHEEFNKWANRDPHMTKNFKGTDGTVGFIYGWNGNKKAGEGEKEIKALVPGKKVDIEMRFKRPFTAVSQTFYTMEPTAPEGTKVTCGISSTLNYPMNLFLVFMDTDKHMGKDMEESLEMLKGNLEK
jgi:hypothetical protein